MCLIICSDPNLHIPKKYIQNGWDNNPDGAGYMFNDEEKGEVIIRKGFFKLKPFINKYKEDKKQHKNSYFVLHFRKISRGDKSVSNCHPFYTHPKKIGIAHNGTLFQLDRDEKKSDTRIFAEMLSKLNDNWTENEAIQILVNDFIGASKLAVLTPHKLWIYSEWIKDKETGLNFSNGSYLNSVKKEDNTPVNNYNTQNYEYNAYENYPRDDYYSSACFEKCTQCGIELMYAETLHAEKMCWDCRDKMNKRIARNNNYW